MRFSSREPLTTEELFARYYAETDLDFGDLCEIWSLIAFYLSVPAERLRPTDRFDAELKPEAGLELIDEVEDLTIFVRVEAGRRGKRLDVHAMQTLDDVVRLLVRRRT